jgi:hypothetical protein
VEGSDGVPKIRTIVRRASDDRTDLLEHSSSHRDSATKQGPPDLDLIEMARQIEG